MAPHNGYAAYGTPRSAVQEFKGMVKSLHDADIEVILDVVYNHTAEGQRERATSASAASTTRRTPAGRRRAGAHYDTTGTGNSLLIGTPRAAADHGLAALLGHRDARRGSASTSPRPSPAVHEVGPLSAFFDLSAGPGREPGQADRRAWDVGDGGYQVGTSRRLWTEWNGKSATRSGTSGAVSPRPWASSLAPDRPSDLYEHSGRRLVREHQLRHGPRRLTMRDLCPTTKKHNEANGEGGNDGESHNRSWNCGRRG